MNESEWLASTDPQAMLRYLNEVTGSVYGHGVERGRQPSDRKLRQWCAGVALFSVQNGVGTLGWWQEAYGEWSYGRKDDFELLNNSIIEQANLMAFSPQDNPLRNTIWFMPQEQKASLLHCIVGNPFQPVITERQYVTDARSKAIVSWFANSQLGENEQDAKLAYRHAVERCLFRQAWLTPAVLSLAQAIYDDHDFALMPILGDALEVAGCDNETVLAHCREPGPHGRGCLVVDLLLGLERRHV